MCREIFGNSTSPQIPGTCDVQARYYCRNLNLGISTLTLLLKFWIPKSITFVFSVIKDSSSIITATFLSIKLYLTLRRHMNQVQLTQVAQNEQGESVQRKRRSAMASLYVYLVFTVCYLPNVCVLIIIGSTSEPRNDLQHLHFYTLTLLFLNSTLNPLIYCWKVKQIRHTDSHTAKYIVKSHLTKPLGGLRTPYQVQTGVKQLNLREMTAFSSYTNYTKFKRASV